jgi:uncharacterized sodium:solute symporter family permease YidK
MLSYFGCDQSQVQRYLSGSSLTQSRLSLLFNAVLKVPMQFLILLTGVLVFVFYHFQAVPLLWNPVERAKLERQAPPGELAAVRERFERALSERRAAAEALARARPGEREAEAADYRAAEAAVGAARGQAVRMIEAINRGARYNDTNYIFPTYVVTHLPEGLAGLVIAVIFAAAMSTLSGEFNSLATASMIDFYKRFVRPSGGDAHELMVSRLLTAFWGAFACLVALRAGQLGSAIEVVNKFGSYVYGPILGVFAIAVLTPRVRAPGAFWGIVVGEAMVACLGYLDWVGRPLVHFLWNTLIGAASVFVTGLLIDVLFSREARA